MDKLYCTGSGKLVEYAVKEVITGADNMRVATIVGQSGGEFKKILHHLDEPEGQWFSTEEKALARLD